VLGIGAIKTGAFESDRGRGPFALEGTVTVGADICILWIIDTAFDKAYVTAPWAFIFIRHSFTASSVSRYPTTFSTLLVFSNSVVAGIGWTNHSGSSISVRSKE